MGLEYTTATGVVEGALNRLADGDLQRITRSMGGKPRPEDIACMLLQGTLKSRWNNGPADQGCVRMVTALHMLHAHFGVAHPGRPETARMFDAVWINALEHA